jgi:hypothetical protein
MVPVGFRGLPGAGAADGRGDDWVDGFVGWERGEDRGSRIEDGELAWACNGTMSAGSPPGAEGEEP